MKPKVRRDSIEAEPGLVARAICSRVDRNSPTRMQVQSLCRQLLKRHSVCRLKPIVSSEEILEGYYRCLITDALVNRHKLRQTAIPFCVNSSHRAVRGVCVGGQHSHSAITDDEWRSGWVAIQKQSPEVNVRVAGRRSPKRADLYVIAGKQVVSVEFKYVGPRGLRDIQGCAAQVRRHAECHAEAILILYSGANRPVTGYGVEKLDALIGLPNAHVAHLAGPEIAAC